MMFRSRSTVSLILLAMVVVFLSATSSVESFSLLPQSKYRAPSSAAASTISPSYPVLWTRQRNNIKTLLTAVPPRQAAAAAEQLVVAGRMGSVLGGFKLIPANFGAICKALKGAFNLGDAALLGIVGWCTIPLFQRYYSWRNRGRQDDDDIKPYDKTWLARYARLIQSAAKATSIIYLFDLVTVVLTTIGFQLDPRVQPGFTKTVYALWGATRLRRAKQFIIDDIMTESKSKTGPVSRKQAAAQVNQNVKIAGRVLDCVLATWLFFFLNDIFQLTLGKGITSILTVGGIASLVISLASKDLAEMLVAGFAIRLSQNYEIGDKVRLGDGTTGNVVQMGTLETYLKGSDGVIQRIPNNQMNHQRVQNLSQTPHCQVKQVLWFRYSDIDKIPRITQAIKDELRACPEVSPVLITDGSRPFRVHWTDFKDDHLQVVVNVNLGIKPHGTVYHDKRQALLEGIARAVKKTSVDFAIPNYISYNSEVTAPLGSFDESSSKTADHDVY